MIEQLRARGLALRAPVDSAWLAAFRVLFGLTLLTSTLRFLAYGWIDQLFTEPQFHFKYWGFSWVTVLDASELHALFWLLAALCVCISLGFLFRAASLGLFLGFSYLQLLDVTTYLNHYYLASLLALLLACSPAGKIWLLSRTDTPLIGSILARDWAAPVMSWAGFLFDTGIPWLLMVPRLRPLAYLVVIGFHSVTGLLFPIGMFPVIMVLCALVFFPPSWPRSLAARLRIRMPTSGAKLASVPEPKS